jgi:hypothetical protein
MSCLLGACLGKLFTPKMSLFDSDDEEQPSLYENIKDSAQFKIKSMKKSRDLKVEMAERDKERKLKLKKLNARNLTISA